MSYVKWILDTSDGEGIDPYDPLGTIQINGDVGSIEDNCTYLDGYFEALMFGIQGLKKGEINAIEPDEIIFDYTRDYLLISYGEQQATIFNVEKFIQDARQSIKNLLDILSNAPVRKNEVIPDFEVFEEFIQNI